METLQKGMLALKTRHFSLFFAVLLLSSVFWIGINGQTARSEVAELNKDPFLASSGSTGNFTNVILLGWDGVQRNHLFELLSAGLMPNLSTFVQTGKLVNVTVSDHYTDTKAGWTQILTGYRWWKTGVFQNSNWFNAIPRGYTILERLKNIYGSTQISTAFITGKLNQMEIEDGTGTAAVGSPFAIYSDQALYDNLPSQVDVVSVGDLEQDRYANVVGPLTLQFLQNNTNNRFFAFFHFSDPDHIGHLYGENSPEYSSAIETCDYWLGQILNTLNTNGLSHNTLIYITPDHGFDEGATAHQNAPYIFLATNDNNVIRNGDEVDIAPTVYYGLGLWSYTFSPQLDGYPMQLNLTTAEDQHRQAVLADNSIVPTPSINVTDNGLNQKKVAFTATDDNLAAVLLLVDNRLRTDVSMAWNYTGTVTAYGSYNIDTASLNVGLHNVKILAFDEHGANNGGVDKPSNGGWPSINEIDFYVGTQPTPTSSPTPTSISTITPTPAQTFAPTSMPTRSPNPSPIHSGNTTNPTSNPSGILNETSPPFWILLGAVPIFFAIIAAAIFAVRKRKRAK